MSPSVFIVDTNVVVAGLITDSSDSPVASGLDAMLAGHMARRVRLQRAVTGLQPSGATSFTTLEKSSPPRPAVRLSA